MNKQSNKHILLREYTIDQGYVWKGLTPENYGYDNCLQYILHGVFKKLEPGDRILSKVLLDCPEITEGNVYNII